jgi:malate dehydrogenase (quinone)
MILKDNWMHNDHLSERIQDPDVVLIGGGLMSATLGTLLKQLEPSMTIQVVEALPRVGMESSNAWNNAGTGHAALCELNYTPEKKDGTVDISKALKINEQFETSKHFWAYLVRRKMISDPAVFVRRIPHISFVQGEKNRDFLRRRREAMCSSHLFENMEFTDDPGVIEEWAPLLMQGRSGSEPLAATRVPNGTDVNYGKLTGLLMDHLLSL